MTETTEQPLNDREARRIRVQKAGEKPLYIATAKDVVLKEEQNGVGHDDTVRVGSESAFKEPLHINEPGRPGGRQLFKKA